MSFQNNTTDKPVIGISIGDFNGVGPEVIIKTLSDSRITKICTPVIYGSGKIFTKYKKILEIEDFNFNQTKDISGILFKKVNLITCWEDDFEVQPGSITPEAGKAAFISLEKMMADLLSGKLDGIVTAPINKKNMQSAGFNYPGHTQYITEKAGGQSLMMMVSAGIRVGVVTDHIPLSEVPASLSKEVILKSLNIMLKTLQKDFDIQKPKIAILGLNPHAGEEGLLGKEENEILKPLIEEMKNKSHLVFGPFPSDGFFGSGHFKKFDGILAMYHDQGLIPFKLLAFETGVNYTAGLNIVRTSPDHGTAYDIAGKNEADESSFREALYLAADIAKTRKPVLI